MIDNNMDIIELLKLFEKSDNLVIKDYEISLRVHDRYEKVIKLLTEIEALKETDFYKGD